MLVNVSLFNNVQAQLTDRVSEYVDDLLQQIRQYMKLDSAWFKYPELADLERRYRVEFQGKSTWDEVRSVLYDSVSNVKTLLVNQSIKDANERLNYRRYEGERLGRRVIAIGGLTLSRGLTLEGLSTSYFYRHSKAYDTLLQMGRWFGYRPGYDDLCRVWMDTDAKQWYTHIASAVTELRADLNQMMLTKQTPRDFSIRVKSHESGLIVTARNKMRSSKEIIVDQNFSGRVIETPLFYRNSGSGTDLNLNNLEVVRTFFSTIVDRFDSNRDASKARLWTAVDKVRVAALIEQLEIPPQNLPFMRDADGRAPIVEFIRDSDSPKMQRWDVVLQQGTAEEIPDFFDERYPVGGYRGFSPVTRRFDKPKRSSSTIGVNRSRIGQRLDTTHGMSHDQLEAARLDWNSHDENVKASPSARHFCKFRSSPVLTIYVIKGNSLETILAAGLKKDLDNLEDLEQGLANQEDLGSGVYVGISIGFPGDASSSGQKVRYRLNLIAQRNAGLVDDEDDDDESQDDLG